MYVIQAASGHRLGVALNPWTGELKTVDVQGEHRQATLQTRGVAMWGMGQ